MDKEVLVFAVLIGGFILWQLVTGKVLGRNWKVHSTRLTDPLGYWLVILGQCAMLAIFLVLSGIDDDEPARTASSGEASPGPAPNPRRHDAFELHRSGKLSEAIVVYDELLQASKRDAELYYWRAMAHWAQQDLGQASSDFYRVIELQPSHYDAHVHIDRILTRQQQWDEILHLWNRYLVLVPNSADAYFERGGTNYRKGDFPAAQADAAKACSLGKQDACAWAKRLEGRR